MTLSPSAKSFLVIALPPSKCHLPALSNTFTKADTLLSPLVVSKVSFIAVLPTGIPYYTMQFGLCCNAENYMDFL